MIFKEFEEWKSTGLMTSEIAELIDQQFDKIMKKEIRGIESLIAIDKKPYLAFAQLMSLSFFLNAALRKRSSILEKLDKWVKYIKNALNKVAEGVEASGFSIGVDFPLGLSISLSFPVST